MKMDCFNTWDVLSLLFMALAPQNAKKNPLTHLHISQYALIS